MEDYLKNIQTELLKKSPLYLRVKILPKSPKNEIFDRLEDGTYKIRVTAAPLKGAANEGLCRFLKKALEAREVVVVTGGREKVKLIRISL